MSDIAHTASGATATLALAGGLRFAAAPTFAIMAILTSIGGGPAADVLCAQGASPLSGMAAMYALMSALHLSPWLKLLAHR